MDDRELILGDKSAESGDFNLVLQPPANDPFLEKKKTLLESKGFHPLGRIPLKKTCDNGLPSTLESLVQIARVICSDEVELYFSKAQSDPSGWFLNPIIELEALHLILSVINETLSRVPSANVTTTSVLFDLRNASISKIHELGDKNVLETKIVTDNSCDKEKQLLEWGESNGVRTKLEVAYIEGVGRGAIAVEDLHVGDIAMEIPVSIIISEKLVRESHMFPILEKIDDISSDTMLLLWSMKEKYSTDSKFKSYFDALPEAFNTGLSFGVKAIMALEGTLLLEEIMQAKEHLRKEYDELFPALCKNHPDIFPAELYTWEKFLWACELWYSNGMKVMFTDGKLRTCLVPIAGFLNHSLCPHVLHYGKVDPATRSLKFRLSRPCNAGEQCYLSYGKLSSSHLVTFYGFVPEGDNPYDIIPLACSKHTHTPLRIDVKCPPGTGKSSMIAAMANFLGYDVYDLELTEVHSNSELQKLLMKTSSKSIIVLMQNIDSDEPISMDDSSTISNWTIHMVRGAWLSSNKELFHYGLPTPLLDYFRKARSLTFLSDPYTQENLESEKNILEDLLSTFGAMMDALGDDSADESASWDVKLAMKCKDIQRSIASSVIVSCLSGVKLVEDELSIYGMDNQD